MKLVETCVSAPKSFLTTGVHASSEVYDNGRSDIRNAVGVAQSENDAKHFVDALNRAAGQQCLGERVVAFFTAMTTKEGSTLPPGLLATPTIATLHLSNGVAGYRVTLLFATPNGQAQRTALSVDLLPVQRGKAVVLFGAVGLEEGTLDQIISEVLHRL